VKLAEQRYAFVARLDLLRLVGPGHMWRRRHAGRRFDRMLREHAERVIVQMWQEGADAVGAEMELVSPTLFEFRRGQTLTRISLSTTPFHDLVSTRVAEDKPLAYRILAAAGIPIPDHDVVDAADPAAARPFFERFQPPFVVKPAQGGGGAGVVGEIHTFDQLRRALSHLRRLAPRAIVERQVDGDSYRLLFLDGELLDVLSRSRPRVVGDGSSTVEQLIFREHERRIAAGPASGLKPFIVDLDCLYSIEHAGYELGSVVPAGLSTVVKTATNYNSREEIRSGELPESTIETARRAARLLGCRLAGVDLVTPEATRPLAEAGAVLEVEPVPGLGHHYRTDGTGGLKITVPILNALLEASLPG
jgi:D-alanine-D-alanine ligase-like ATP-grasp enzyme